MRQRLTFLDILRAWAALVMIEVHVVNAFLVAPYREAAWFPFLNYVNGLVAPAFLFVAGFAFAYTSERAAATPAERRSKFLRQVRRIGMVLAAGYMLHLPGFGWTKVSQAPPEAWLKFYQADILHTIGVGLFILLLAREFLGGRTGVLRTAGIVGGLTIVAAPWVWMWDAQASLPAPLAAYMNGAVYSQFPLFPWLGFLMVGALVAATYPTGGTTDDAKAWFRRTGFAGLVLFGVAAIARWPDWSVGLPWVHIRANPWFVAERIGVLLVLVWLAGQWSLRHATLSPALRDVSRESLQVYVVHLLVIYGDWFDGRSLWFMHRQSLDLPAVGAATLVLTATMVATAWAWQRAKGSSERWSRLGFYAGVGIAVMLFFLR